MKLARRRFIAGTLVGSTGITGIVALTAGAPAVRAAQTDRLSIFDNRLPGSREVVTADAELLTRRIDLAELDERGWFALRSLDLRDVADVSGCTAWQDFVVLRDLLREHRLRPAAPEQRLDVAEGRSLFLWRMTR